MPRGQSFHQELQLPQFCKYYIVKKCLKFFITRKALSLSLLLSGYPVSVLCHMPNV